MKKASKVVLCVVGSLAVLGIIGNMIGDNKQSNTTSGEPAATVSDQAETKNTKAKTKNDEEAAAKKKAADEAATAQKKTEQQAAAKEQQKVKLDAEIQNAKNGSYQDKMKAMKDYINLDKADLLAKNPTTQDMGFAGDLFIQTNKNTVYRLNSIGNSPPQSDVVYLEVQVILNDASSNPIQVDSNMFTLVTSDGRKYSTDTAAEMMLVNAKPIIMDTLNPDVDDTGYLIFDVPADLNTSDVTLNVRNGLFSNVKLKIS